MTTLRQLMPRNGFWLLIRDQLGEAQIMVDYDVVHVHSLISHDAFTIAWSRVCDVQIELLDLEVKDYAQVKAEYEAKLDGIEPVPSTYFNDLECKRICPDIMNGHHVGCPFLTVTKEEAKCL